MTQVVDANLFRPAKQVEEKIKVNITSAIAELVKPMPKLGFKKEKNLITEKELADLKVSLDSAIKSQNALGLGDPTESAKGTLRAAKNHNKFQEAKQQALALKRVFSDWIEPPSKEFHRFDNPAQAFTVGLPASKLPEFAMVRLGKGVKGVEIRVGPNTYRANLPLIPSTAQELAKRAKEIAPKGQFHLLFMPSWEKQPQRDPVLLYKIANRYCVIASWDGDAEIIQTHLKEERKNQ